MELLEHKVQWLPAKRTATEITPPRDETGGVFDLPTLLNSALQ
jgi:hypothetical protein